MPENYEALTESFKQMDSRTLQRIIIEAEAYLKGLTKTNILMLLKGGVGMGLECSVLQPEKEVDALKILASTPVWRDLGKFITMTGTLMHRAGVGVHIVVESGPNQDGTGHCAVTIGALPPCFGFITDAEEDQITAKDVLAFLAPNDN